MSTDQLVNRRKTLQRRRLALDEEPGRWPRQLFSTKGALRAAAVATSLTLEMDDTEQRAEQPGQDLPRFCVEAHAAVPA
jgi:hypothetical protein